VLATIADSKQPIVLTVASFAVTKLAYVRLTKAFKEQYLKDRGVDVRFRLAFAGSGVQVGVMKARGLRPQPLTAAALGIKDGAMLGYWQQQPPCGGRRSWGELQQRCTIHRSGDCILDDLLSAHVLSCHSGDQQAPVAVGSASVPEYGIFRCCCCCCCCYCSCCRRVQL
jgi:hypothetical protein